MWQSGLTLVAYSQNGYSNQTWTLPATWNGVTRVNCSVLSPTAPENPVVIPVVNGTVTLTLGAGDARVLTAVDPPDFAAPKLQNSSFEVPLTPLYSVPTGWTVESGNAFNTPTSGGLVPTDGVRALGLGNTPNVEDRLVQEIACPPANTIYRVRFRIGWRNDDPNPLSVLRQGSLRVEFGGNRLTEMTKTFSTANGDLLGAWTTLETYFTTPRNANPNQPLRIVLVGDSGGGIQTWFDQVEIETVGPFKVSSVSRDANNNVSLHWASEPGRTYQIETSSDLVNWSPVATGISSQGFDTTTSFPNPANDHAFFRVTRN
jgi:hypothetical protein